MRPRSLYVHVPFCARRCSYCDFAVQATREPPVHAWIEAVGSELELVARSHGWTAPLDLETLYIGGGTPSLLGTGAMAALADRLREHAVWDPDQVEWTCEANPESFTAELADDWRAAGINRISLGVQTFHADALRWMGRLHGPDGPARAMAAARHAGFDNVSIDLIFALPDRLRREWATDIERALALEPEHISLYGLTAEPGAALGRWVREGRERMAEDDRYADEYLLAHERVTAAGFEHYEVSNFARAGRRSRHNSVYWTGLPYAALGPGAHGYDPPRRSWNLRGWDAYRNEIARGQLPIEEEEIVSTADASLERGWLQLRTSSGISLHEITPGQRALVHEWVQRGLARAAADRVVLTAQGWLLLDRLAVELDAVAASVAEVAASSRM
jgi:oxygen-independent coproporphyrinogen-3 oxidase